MSTQPGWAIRRNGLCLLTEEVDCGEKASPFRACCPSSTTCPVQYNTACCPANTNCTAALVEIPICANSSWVMFDNGGYFCCERGQVGYNIYDTDGCSLSGRALPQDAVPLAVVDQTSFSAPKSTSMRPTTSPSGSPPPPPNTNNTVSGGTIAGAVVGGIAGVATIAGLLWWSFMRGKTSSSVATNQVSQPPQGSNGGGNQNSGYSTAP
ncbi:hypothetical protein GGR51DRAFT_573190 [Nemania sp. FL0031]|nr:hypothetical protein GGR51DRAFT_573190 [Nemania sp. FL0031]